MHPLSGLTASGQASLVTPMSVAMPPSLAAAVGRVLAAAAAARGEDREAGHAGRRDPPSCPCAAHPWCSLHAGVRRSGDLPGVVAGQEF